MTKNHVQEKPKISGTFAKVTAICDALDQEKAQDIRIMDVREVTMLADYFIVCTGTSSVHINAVTEGVQERLAENGLKAMREGIPGSSWTVLDYGDVIVHIFSEELREFYTLESLWSDAKTVNWDPAMVFAD